MTRLEALNDLYNPGEYGRVRAGDRFTARNSTAAQLVKQGSARRVEYETKVVVPEVPALSAGPFRDVHLPDTEPAAVAAESDRMLDVADVSAPDAADSRKRSNGRKRSQ